MQMFIATVIVFWLPLMFWWLLKPQCFPFLSNKQFGRWSLFGLNLGFYVLVVIMLGVVFSSEQPHNQEPSTSEMLGMFAGFGAIIWVIARGIKVGKLAKVKNPPKQSQPDNQPKRQKTVNDSQVVPSHLPPEPLNQPKPPAKPKKPRKPKEPIPQPPKPALKEDFELGNDDLCEMQYKNSKGEITTRTILIRTLKANKNGDWLVSAVDIEAKRLKNFRIDRIISLSHNNQTWTEYDDILGIVRTFETLM